MILSYTFDYNGLKTETIVSTKDIVKQIHNLLFFPAITTLISGHRKRPLYFCNLF